MTTECTTIKPTEPTPDWVKPCTRCGHEVARYRGVVYPLCHNCYAEYNAGGQRRQDDWRGNPSTWDEDISDLDGYVMQHAEDDDDA